MLKVRYENNYAQFKGYDTYTYGTKTKKPYPIKWCMYNNLFQFGP